MLKILMHSEKYKQKTPDRILWSAVISARALMFFFPVGQVRQKQNAKW